MADIGEIMTRGQSGPFPRPRLTLAELQLVSRRCLAENRALANIEAFEITADWDIYRSEFSYRERGELRTAPWPERVKATAKFVDSLADDLVSEQNPIMFEIWITDAP